MNGHYAGLRHRMRPVLYGALTGLALTALVLRPAVAAAGQCRDLTEWPAVTQHEGVWEGRWWIRDEEGRTEREYTSIKTMQVHADRFLQTNVYRYPDGSEEQRRFYGLFNADCELQFHTPDIPAFADFEVILVEGYDGVLMWPQTHIPTGRLIGVEFFTVMGDERTATSHRYDWTGDFGNAGVTTIHEQRTAPAPAEPLFELEAGWPGVD